MFNLNKNFKNIEINKDHLYDNSNILIIILIL